MVHTIMGKELLYNLQEKSLC